MMPTFPTCDQDRHGGSEKLPDLSGPAPTMTDSPGIMLVGEVASRGLAKGTAFVFGGEIEPRAPRRKLGEHEVQGEIEKLDAAIVAAEVQLRRIQHNVRVELGEQEAQIFDAHVLLLLDPSLREEVSVLCLRKRINVEAALEEAIGSLCAAFMRISDPFFRERAADLRDIGKRLMDSLAGEGFPEEPPFPPNSVIVARELFPSLTAQLDGGRVRAAIVESGSQTAHATILARAKGIPLLINVPGATTRIQCGDALIVDGVAGRIFLNPNPGIRDEYDQLEADLHAHQSALDASIDLPSETRDGTRIELRANIGKLADAEAAARVKADGVGLYRTEFAFQVHGQFPTEEEQTRIYQAAAERMKPREVVIRVLDIGSDKLLSYFPLPAEANPSLGCRGTRLLLAHPEILDVQLRAILRVSATHPVSILFPMVCGVETMRAAKAAVERSKAALTEAAVPFNRSIRVGAMIETPAAAILASKLAREADFFSVGTNDLVQYLLTTDRTSSEMGSYYEPLHPAVLHRLRSVAQDAQCGGVSLSICGEMAGNPVFTELLIGFGYRNFSVNPGDLLEIKNAIRGTDLCEAETLARDILELSTVKEIKERLFSVSPPLADHVP